MGYNVTNVITLDVRNNNPQIVRAKQYDKNTRYINIKVADGDTIYNLSGYTVYFKAKTPDNRAILKRCTVNNDGSATIILDDNILNANGRIKSEIEIVDNNGVLSTMLFDIHCISSTCKDSEITESDEFSALTDALIRVEALEVNVTTNESIRQENENTRELNETARISNENTRKSNETVRISNENTRESNETTRVGNENVRISNENTRKSNETTRQTNESHRQNTMNQIETDLSRLENELDTVVLKDQLGVASTSLKTGVATLNNNGKVPESQLPSFVDDVLEGTAQGKTQTASGGYTATGFILTGKTTACTPEAGKIYVDTTDLIQYRWSGSVYVSIGSHLALGMTASTAFPGDKGKSILDSYVSKIKGDKESAYRKGSVNLTPENLGASYAKDTHTNLLNPTLGTTTINGVTCTANGDGTYTLTGTASAHTDIHVTPWGTSEYANLIQLEPSKKYKIIGSPSGGSVNTYYMCVVSNNGTTRNNIAWEYNGGEFTALDSAYHYEVKISVTNGTALPSGGLTFKPMLTTDLSATYDDFVQYSGNGELNQNVASLYKHHVTGVKGSAETNYREGNVNITKSNIGLGNVDNTADANKHVAYATTSGNGVSSMTNDGEEITITLNNGNNVKVPARAGEIGVEVTWAEYQALTEEEKNNGNVYYITDYPSGYTSLKEVINHTRTNLLSPTLGTTTVNGVTCTANGDGTYTLNGTSTSSWSIFDLGCNVSLKAGVKYRLTGCPSGGSGTTYRIGLYNENLPSAQQFVAQDIGNGVTFQVSEDGIYDVHFPISPNTALPTNLVFKPMLTTDLSATYDDFVQYSGDGELNQNVASLYNMFFDIAHPVGELYITKNVSFDPNTAKGWHGTWVRDKGTFVRLAGDNDAIGSTGGADTRTLSVENLPSHAHGLNNHVHSLNGHTHSLNGHTHSIPALNGGTNVTGDHVHESKDCLAYFESLGNDSTRRDFFGGQGSILSSYSAQAKNLDARMYPNGNHSHTVTTNASTTGGNSGTTGGNSGNTGAASGNTTTTGSGTAFDNRPYHTNYYGWVRTA